MKRLLLFLLLATSLFGQGQDSIRAVGGVLTIALVPSSTRYKVFVDQTITSTVFTSPVDRATITVLFVQDSTGHTVAFGGNISGGCSVSGSVSSIPSSTTACQFTFDAANNAWSGIGGGGSPVQSLPGPVFNVKDPKYGAIGDTQHIVDGVTGGGTKTITSASAPFKASDVGKKIVCGANVFSTVAKILSVNTPTNTIATTDTTDGGAAGSLKCIWYTQDDTTAFQSANTAANATITSIDPNSGKTLGTPPGTIYCPPGGYAVSSRIYSSVGSGSSVAPSFKGDQGKNHCIIYVIPGLVDPNDGVGVLVASANNVGFDMEDIVIDGLGASPNASHAIVQCFSCTQFTMKRLKITNISTNSLSVGTLDFNGSSGGSTEDIFVQGAGTNNDFACSFNGSAASIVNRNMVCSNHNQNIIVDNGSGVPRNLSGANGITFIGGFNDECAGGNCFVASNGALVNMHDFSLMVGAGANPFALTVDGTSRVYMSNVSCGVFGSTTGTANCMNLASGALVTATNSDLRGNDSNSTTGVAVNGPAGATFVDVGGNKILHSVNGVISAVTAAQFSTLGFTGGIVPTTALTHTYPQPFLPALPASGTALSIVAFTPSNSIIVRNFTITAGNTPTCATPPTFQISNGTQSFTQTFASAAQISGPFTPALTLFPGGTQITLSITTAAYACTTAPTNMNWSIEWESANSF